MMYLTARTGIILIIQFLPFSFQNIDEDSVSKLIDNINYTNSSGVDDLSTMLIKLLKSGLLKLVTTIINQLLEIGIFLAN